MAFTNSPLVTQTKLVKGHSNPRNRAIGGITIHHNAGVASVSALLNYAYNTDRKMSFNYCINDNDIGMLVEEKNRAWTSSNATNDHRCVTIEVCNSSAGGDWPISDKSMATLIKLCADICKRNGIPKLYFDGTINGTLTRHEMFASTNCPGPYIKNHTQYICDEVNKLIGASSNEPTTPTTKYEVVVPLKGYVTAEDALKGTNPKSNVAVGTYFVYKKSNGAINVTKTEGTAGSWINESLNKKEEKPVNPPVQPDSNPIGKDVVVNGRLYGDSAGNNPGKTVSNLKTKVTRYKAGAKCPYNFTGDIGWTEASSVTFVSDNINPKPPASDSPIGKSVVVNGRLYGDSNGGNPGKTVTNLKTKITRYKQGASKPYNFTGDIGWAAASSVKFTDSTISTPTSVDIDAEARKVIRGDYGNGQARKNALTKKFGAEIAEQIQNRVNQLV